MTSKEVVSGVVQVLDPGGSVNSFLLLAEEMWTILDAGLEASGNAILDVLRKAGEDPTQSGQILITHAHGDHVGGLAELKRKTGAQVVAGKEEVSDIQSYVGRPAIVDRGVEDGDQLPGGIQVVSTPGHSPGHTCYLVPEVSVMFVGDALFHREELSEPPAEYTRDTDQARESIIRISQLDFDTACFGHGEPVLEDASAKIRRLVEGF